MNKLSLCTNHIEKPFYIKEINKNIFSIEELDAILAEYGEPISLVGDGYAICEQGFNNTKLNFVPCASRLQSALSVAAVALKKYESGELCTDSALSVNYLRPSQAERERAEREEAKKKMSEE